MLSIWQYRLKAGNWQLARINMFGAILAWVGRAAISSFITGTIEALVSLFRKPAEERLGEANKTIETQAAILDKVEKANEIQDDIRTLNDAAVHDRLYNRWKR